MLSPKNQPAGSYRLVILLAGAALGLSLFVIAAVLSAGNQAGSGALNINDLARQVVKGDTALLWRTLLRDQAQAMSLPFAEGSQAYWFLARAGGIVSYLLLWLATCWGIIMSSKLLKGIISPGLAFSLHEFLPLLGILFAAMHALVLLGDSYISFDMQQLLIPFTSSYKPFWTGLGTIAFYSFIVLTASFYVRKQIGQKSWRVLHYTSYVAFLLALTHGLMAGTDSGAAAMRGLYLVTGGISLFLLYYRLLSRALDSSRSRQSA
jgi:methionine sulfoxide reductase heme-binding subunit